MPSQLSVLWATDGSESSLASVAFLNQWVMPKATTVRVLCVAPVPLLSGARPDPAYYRRWSAQAKQSALEEALAVAQDAASRLRTSASIDATSRFGHPIQEILREARQSGAGLVVVGAKGRSNLQQFLLGSVAQGVLEYCDRPVVVVRDGRDVVRNILVAADGSNESLKAARFVQEFAGKAEDLTLVRVVQPVVTSAGRFTTRWSNEARRINEALATQARLQLSDLARTLASPGRRVVSEVELGAPARQILSAAKIHGADLIVLGSGRPSRARKYLIGSTAEAVARRADCSVLVVR
jgi:nucleotide-binding universal stress UspA family protein